MGIGFKVGAREYDQPHGTYQFTQTGSWTVPDGVTEIEIFLVGAGGKGANGYHGYSDKYYGSGGGAGGGGYIFRIGKKKVNAGVSVLSAIIGSGDTVFTINGESFTAPKGNGGSSNTGGDGQSGGGAGIYVRSGGTSWWGGAAGGTNGGNGGNASIGGAKGGKGTGQNCYINGVLFSSGGHGGDGNSNSTPHRDGHAGTPSTGNGGDGGSGFYVNPSGVSEYGFAGGTGTVIIIY